MKQVAGRLRLDMAAYRELAAFALMASDLDKATRSQLDRGQRMQELLKQPQYQPMEFEEQVIVLLAGTSGYADHVPVDDMDQWQTDLLRYMANSHPEIGKEIIEKKTLSDELRSTMAKAFETFASTWQG
jgi:F-type H+-transporting ATPase subunit alpha